MYQHEYLAEGLGNPLVPQIGLLGYKHISTLLRMEHMAISNHQFIRLYTWAKACWAYAKGYLA